MEDGVLKRAVLVPLLCGCCRSPRLGTLKRQQETTSLVLWECASPRPCLAPASISASVRPLSWQLQLAHCHLTHSTLPVWHCVQLLHR